MSLQNTKTFLIARITANGGTLPLDSLKTIRAEEGPNVELLRYILRALKELREENTITIDAITITLVP